jgi:hypothetical protein
VKLSEALGTPLAMGRFVVLLATVGCHASTLVAASKPFSLPDVIDCGRAVVGSDSACSFQVVNDGPTRLSQWSFQGDFTGPLEVELAPGESQLTLRFKPHLPGPAEALVTVSDEQHVTTLRIIGMGVAPVVCDVMPCRRSTFDLETGQCVTENEADGTSCPDRCVVGGRCAAGQCVGQVRSCDDNDPCTADSCGELDGCRHEARTCPASSSPCEVPVCDATTGCRVVPVVDGTACGVGDCQTAPICLSGRCERRPAPVGSACGTAGLCHGPGRCRGDGTCAPGPSTSPRVAWRFTPPAGRRVSWWRTSQSGRTTVITDDTLGGSFRLQSLDLDGLEAFSIDLSAEDPTIKQINQLLDDDGPAFCLITQHPPESTRRSAFRDSTVSCRDRRTGVRLWQRALSSLAIPVNDPMNGRARFLPQRIASVGNGDVLLLVMEGHQNHTLHALSLDGTNGTTKWRVQRPGHGRLLVGKSGETWMPWSPCFSQTQTVTRISGAGLASGDRVIAWALRAMAEDTPIVTMRTQVLAVAPDGSARLVTTPSAEPWNVLWEDGLLTMHARTAAGNSELLRLALDGGVRFSVPLSGDTSVLQLITDGGVATSTSHPDGGATLRLYSAAGTVFEACELSVPAFEISSSRAIGSSAQGIVAYDLPGIGTAPSGWTHGDGFNRTFRSR